MKKIILIVSLIFNGFFAAVMSIVSVDWILAGGCTRTMNGRYEPAYISQIWEITSHIYTWAPEGTLFRLFFFLIAAIITFGLPVALAIYFCKRFRKNLEEYQKLGLLVFFG